jgi:hypothetical protein
MPTAPRALQRVNYFAGQILAADDLRAEQDYLLERWRRHNRWCHGWGVVTGLEVTLDGHQVVVAEGMALDCQGGEVVVPERAALALPSGRAAKYLLLSRVEIPTAPVPVPGEPAESASSLESAPSRIREGWALTWAATDPGRAHRRRGRKWETCGEAHGVALGRLRRTGGRWRLDRRYRVRHACW